MSTLESQSMEEESVPMILALDTSSKLTSMVISQGYKVIARFGAALDENRSTKLWEILDFILGTVALKIEAIDLFAVCTGPGGFTGLRVGMAATKAFATATGKLTVGVTSLEACAASVKFAPNVYALLNAYKGEVYAQLFSFDENEMPVAQNDAIVCTIDKALDQAVSIDQLIWVGDAAITHAGSISRFKQELMISQNQHAETAEWQIAEYSGYLAPQVARLACYQYQSGLAVRPGALQVNYVRGADIKIKMQTKP